MGDDIEKDIHCNEEMKIKRNKYLENDATVEAAKITRLTGKIDLMEEGKDRLSWVEH